MTDQGLRQSVIDAALQLVAEGLNKGTAGNVSLRTEENYIITPSGVDYDKLRPQDLVTMDFDGNITNVKTTSNMTPSGKSPAQLEPSSEWRFHQDIYIHHPEAGAIVHCHSLYATALSTLRREIPPFHYMVAIAGGNSIRCAEYATFGTQELSSHVVTALFDRKACLMSNHGLIAFGKDLREALKIAVEVENLAGQYMQALQVGQPVLLSETEMAIIGKMFNHYGRQNNVSMEDL
ncbi:MAG: class II aldolase [Gammaproteobacteria bacterium]|nr:MAG: class II aldolase [Gammaproteobacteria bacterium]